MHYLPLTLPWYLQSCIQLIDEKKVPVVMSKSVVHQYQGSLHQSSGGCLANKADNLQGPTLRIYFPSG